MAANRKRVLRQSFKVDRAELAAVVSAIRAQDEPPDTNEVDGWFFWDCCRQEYAGLVAEMTAALPTDLAARSREVIANGMADDLVRAFGFPPEWAYWRLVHGQVIPMRPPSIRALTAKDPRLVYAIEMHVGQATLTGGDFVRLVRKWEEFQARTVGRDGYRFVTAHDSDQKDVRLLFQRHDNGFVSVRVMLPLPPDALLEAAYDTYVCGDSEWLRSMPDGAVERQQSSAIAMRTWIIGLLMGSGESWDSASSQAANCFEVKSASNMNQDSFSRDRVALLHRVPEAEPFLMQRKPRRTR